MCAEPPCPRRVTRKQGPARRQRPLPLTNRRDVICKQNKLRPQRNAAAVRKIWDSL
jgi:hypothetical protein